MTIKPRKKMPYVIIRCKNSGVFAGYLASRKGSEVEIKRARKLWKWSGAAAVEELSLSGVKNPHDCKFTVVVKEITVTDALQVIPCTTKAKQIIEGVPEWKA